MQHTNDVSLGMFNIQQIPGTKTNVKNKSQCLFP